MQGLYSPLQKGGCILNQRRRATWRDDFSWALAFCVSKGGISPSVSITTIPCSLQRRPSPAWMAWWFPLPGVCLLGSFSISRRVEASRLRTGSACAPRPGRIVGAKQMGSLCPAAPAHRDRKDDSPYSAGAGKRVFSPYGDHHLT